MEIGLKANTWTREYREGWIGRKRTYHCRSCGYKFRVDTRDPLPEELRLCEICRERDYKSG